MMFVLMGVALLVSLLAFGHAVVRALRYRFWAVGAAGVTFAFALGLIAEGFERMGWTT